MKAIKVLRTSKNTSRCLLDNGWSVKIPTDLLNEDFGEMDFVRVTVGLQEDLVHTTLYKPKRVPKQPKVVRDMSKFNCNEEFKLLKSIVLKNVNYFAWKITDEQLEDLASDCFLHFWERSLFQGYNPSVCGYHPYISRAVRNYMIDRFRSPTKRRDQKVRSLDRQLKDDSETTLVDTIASPEQTYSWEGIQYDPELLSRLEKAVYALDGDGTGLQGVNYSDIFRVVFQLVPTTFDEYVASTGYSRSTIRARQKILVDWLKPVYDEWLAMAS